MSMENESRTDEQLCSDCGHPQSCHRLEKGVGV